MAQSWAESTWEINNYGKYINQFPPNTIKSIWQNERINKKICRQKIIFNEICVCIYIYIYIYMYISVCVYIYIYICISQKSSSLLSFLLRCGTRSNEWDTQRDVNSVV